MDINYYMKLQNAYGTNSIQEKQLAKVNYEMSKHFEDTFDTEDVLLNGEQFKLMIIKDTDGNTFKKKIKSPNNKPFNLGDYVKWNNQYWMVTLLDNDDKTWCRGYMYQCSVLLRWQNKYGKIIERWAYSEDFTKYASGINGNSYITVGDYQYGLTLPVDDETKYLKRDVRFPIDIEGVEPPDIYKLTNRKVLITDSRHGNRGGILTITLSYNVFNEQTDKKVLLEDGTEVWICDYVDLNSKTVQLKKNISLSITHKGSESIMAGGNYKKFSAIVKDSEDNILDNTQVKWTLVALSENEKFISSEIQSDNSIKIKSLYDKSIIGTKILLTASLEDKSTSIYITIGGGI